MQAHVVRSPIRPVRRPREEVAPAWLQAEDRQLRRMMKVGFAFFLVCCAVLRLFRGRGPGDHRSTIQEARDAAGTYIPMGFSGW